MLKRTKLSDRLLLPAALAFVGFWYLALTDSLPIPNKPQHPISNAGEKCTTRECHEDATADALVFYTEVLAIFTGVLAVVSFVQGIFLYRADRAAKIAADASRVATERGMDLAERQFLLEGRRADLAEKQHGLLRTQFFATHRPKLRVRLFRLHHLEVGKPVVVDYEIVNVGDTEARDVERQMAISVFMGAATPPIDGVSLPFDHPISFGESRLVSWKTAIIYANDWRAFSMELTGRIVYRDGNGVTRRTAFDRCYTAAANRFDPMGDPDREYED